MWPHPGCPTSNSAANILFLLCGLGEAILLSRQAARTWKALSEQCFYGQTLSATGSLTTARGMLSLCKVREDGHVMSALCKSVKKVGNISQSSHNTQGHCHPCKLECCLTISQFHFLEVCVLILLNLINLISIQSQGMIRWTKFMFIESFDRFEDLSFVSGFTHSVICMQLTKCTWKKRKRVFIGGAKHPLRVASLGLLQSHQFISTVNGTCLSYLSAAGCVEFPLWSHVPIYT